MVFVHFNNAALDFTKGEEHIVTITETKTRRTKNNNYYQLIFSPDIKGKNFIEVPGSLYNKAKPNDKLRLFLKNGVFGLPYISSDRQLIE